MPLKLLAVGDIHLGRQPSRLPEEFADRASELGPAGAWRRLVERAIEEGVHVVALAGDVVEREDDFYEAYRELKKGVARLADAGIRVLGVAGNHDVHVLPRLADQLENFELIGRGGDWQRITLEEGGEQLTLHGWSFRDRQVPDSPLKSFRFERGNGPNLGLLHCDRDKPGSPYAPVTSSELRSAGPDGWLLGHIHAPDPLSVENLSGYLGCISGMDPGEPGDHGPWLITVDGGRIAETEQWVLAPLRFEPMALDITELRTPEHARDLLIERLEEKDAHLASLALPPHAVAVRLTFTGRSNLGAEVEELFAGENTLLEFDSGAAWFLERCMADTRPTIPLAELAGRNDPPGLLASRLRLLEAPESDAARQLINQARQDLEARLRDARWQPLGKRRLDDATVVDYLRRSGTRLLEEMLAQRETSS